MHETAYYFLVMVFYIKIKEIWHLQYPA